MSDQNPNDEFAQKLVGGDQTKEASETEDEAFSVEELLKESADVESSEGRDAVSEFVDLMDKSAEDDEEEKDEEGDEESESSDEESSEDSDSGDEEEAPEPPEGDEGDSDEGLPEEMAGDEGEDVPPEEPAGEEPAPAEPAVPGNVMHDSNNSAFTPAQGGIPPMIEQLLAKLGSDQSKEAGDAEYSDEEALRDAAQVLQHKVASGVPVDELILGHEETKQAEEAELTDEEAQKVAEEIHAALQQ